MNKKLKHIMITSILLLICAISLGHMSSPLKINTHAASITKQTKKAKKLYKKKIKEIYWYSELYDYKITDICGSKVPELIVDYTPQGEKHGTLVIFTYKNGKIKKILEDRSDNLKIYCYKKSNLLITFWSYHDYQTYCYFKYTNGKYKLKLTRDHNLIYDELDDWHYHDAKENDISKATFTKRLKKLQKGKIKDLHADKWKWYHGYYW